MVETSGGAVTSVFSSAPAPFRPNPDSIWSFYHIERTALAAVPRVGGLNSPLRDSSPYIKLTLEGLQGLIGMFRYEGWAVNGSVQLRSS